MPTNAAGIEGRMEVQREKRRPPGRVFPSASMTQRRGPAEICVSEAPIERANRSGVGAGRAVWVHARLSAVTRAAMRELEAALDALPLFPLPAVLFPGALMPLHVFEPRYRAMVRDALATNGALAVVFVTDAADVDAHGHPRIASLAGAGVIADHAELPNGRYNILVQGIARVHLEELPFLPPYRRARGRIIETSASDVPATDIAALRAAAAAFAARVREKEPRFELHLPADADAAAITDLCAHHLVLDARERQTLLETADLAVRARRTTEALVIQRVALSTDRRDMN